MERRTFLTGAAGALATIAGCVGSAPETPDDGPAATDTPTPTPAAPTIIARSLEPRQDCEQPGSATVSTDGTTVTVDGCIVGKNGCMVASLASATYDADADELGVRVATRDESDEDEMCTQQLVERGYTVTVEFDGGLPGTTTVTHDGVDGEQQVARSRTGE
ncbi:MULTISPECIES: hypothetical protein [Halolamina]|uniref:Tat (Twin-arginine translocation) pathway signal sequence n=1 Tax=Halolamina pelagica TaxID=699431 RepID=A0A1I5TDY0_9EURY|nr:MULTISPECIES: hypothetical protein [Halolamina]SFP81252.1 hypothetical protein SAMN05216277_10939 [Halolamina pelagica]